MKNILEIYKEYKMMPNLVEHQFRVSGVAMQICDALHESVVVDRDAILKACLVHDMGNIIKFKLNYFPEFLEPFGLEYWQDVQNEFIKKYGNDEHIATIKIAKELDLSEKVINHINAIDFKHWCNVFKRGNMEEEICVYADSRVAPEGVFSQKERLEEGSKRYHGRSHVFDSQINTLHTCAENIENHVFSFCNIKPDDINDESVAFYLEYLKKVEI